MRIKFTEKGQVRIECRIDDGRLLTSVADTGIGIKPEDIAKLFTTFRQLDSTPARKHEGTGLGLAICQKLADLLGGEIWAESAWGGGSIFTFVLPFKGKEEDHEAADSNHRG
jgi:signal transduction histidine kinase